MSSSPAAWGSLFDEYHAVAHPLRLETTKVGRNDKSEVDIQISEQQVSGVHFCIYKPNGDSQSCLIQDNYSCNGTWLNPEPDDVRLGRLQNKMEKGQTAMILSGETIGLVGPDSEPMMFQLQIGGMSDCEEDDDDDETYTEEDRGIEQRPEPEHQHPASSHNSPAPQKERAGTPDDEEESMALPMPFLNWPTPAPTSGTGMTDGAQCTASTTSTRRQNGERANLQNHFAEVVPSPHRQSRTHVPAMPSSQNSGSCRSRRSGRESQAKSVAGARGKTRNNYAPLTLETTSPAAKGAGNQATGMTFSGVSNAPDPVPFGSLQGFDASAPITRRRGEEDVESSTRANKRPREGLEVASIEQVAGSHTNNEATRTPSERATTRNKGTAVGGLDNPLVEQLQEENQSLKRQLKLLQETMKKTENEASSYRVTTSDDLAKHQSMAKELKQKIDDLTKEKQKLQKDAERQQTSYHNLKRQLDTCTAEKIHLQEQNVKQHCRFQQDLEKRANCYNTELQTLKMQVEHHQAQMNKHQEEIAELREAKDMALKSLAEKTERSFEIEKVVCFTSQCSRVKLTAD